MKYTFDYNGESYSVDTEKLFDAQTDSFKEVWSNAKKVQMNGYAILENECMCITVYDRGGVIVNKKESEVKND